MIPTIKRATHADIEPVSHIIARAFADDPLSVWFCGETDLFRKTVSIMMRDTYLRDGFVTWTEGKAASLWMRPGQTGGLSFFANLQLLTSTFLSVGPKKTWHSLEGFAAMDAAKPKTPLLYLFAIGVDPEAQGQGLGSLLIKDGLREADEKGVPAYLESSKEVNIPLYERHGFKVIKEVRVSPGAPVYWSMLREPRT